MKAKNGLKRMKMVKESEFTYVDLLNKYLKKCRVNNLSEYTIKFYEVSSRTFGKFVNTVELNQRI